MLNSFDLKSLGAIRAVDSEPRIQQAINEIYATYGDVVSVGQKAKSLTKFGRNVEVGTSFSTIWFTGQDQANETYVADNVNSIDSISSSSGSDTMQVTIEGHTMSGGCCSTQQGRWREQIVDSY